MNTHISLRADPTKWGVHESWECQKLKGEVFNPEWATGGWVVLRELKQKQIAGKKTVLMPTFAKFKEAWNDQITIMRWKKLSMFLVMNANK